MAALTDHFSRIVLISLAQHPERAAVALCRLKECGITGPETVSVHSAWPGNEGPAPIWFRAGNAAWGCLMSHVRAVQDALLDGVDRLLLLEDDIFFHDRSPKWLERLMHDVPKDWDQIYLGGQHLKEATPLSGTPYIWRARNINRTHAYALHRRVFAKFLQHVLHAPDYIRRGAWHIDHQLGLAHERGDWRTYTPAWWLCAQEEGGSSISGKINPRMWWQPFIYAKQLPFVYFPHEGTAYEPSLHFEDGFEEALKNNTMLQRWLDTAALNALNRYKLPAWRSTVPALERITAMWPAGVRDAENCDLNALAAYPENGLFIHPLTQAPSTTVELSPGFAA